MFSILSERLAGLRRRYAEPHRAYHGQAHVDALLAGLAAEGPHIGNKAATELAIWYHDAIYNPNATDNEARSADLLVTEIHEDDWTYRPPPPPARPVNRIRSAVGRLFAIGPRSQSD